MPFERNKKNEATNLNEEWKIEWAAPGETIEETRVLLNAECVCCGGSCAQPGYACTCYFCMYVVSASNSNEVAQRIRLHLVATERYSRALYSDAFSGSGRAAVTGCWWSENMLKDKQPFLCLSWNIISLKILGSPWWIRRGAWKWMHWNRFPFRLNRKLSTENRRLSFRWDFCWIFISLALDVNFGRFQRRIVVLFYFLHFPCHCNPVIATHNLHNRIRSTMRVLFIAAKSNKNGTREMCGCVELIASNGRNRNENENRNYRADGFLWLASTGPPHSFLLFCSRLSTLHLRSTKQQTLFVSCAAVRSIVKVKRQ